MQPDQFVARITEHPADAGVGIKVAAVGIGDCDEALEKNCSQSGV
jgi:hypothetical protein